MAVAQWEEFLALALALVVVVVVSPRSCSLASASRCSGWRLSLRSSAAVALEPQHEERRPQRRRQWEQTPATLPRSCPRP